MITTIKNNLTRVAMMLLLVVLSSSGAWAQTTTFTYSASEKVTKFDTYENFTGATAVTSHTFADGTGTVVYEGTVTGIGKNALNSCTTLTAIAVPASVEIICSGAFYNCQELANISFAEDSELTTIEGAAFWGCKKLTSIDLPETLTTLGHIETIMEEEVEQGSVFADCGLTSLHFPKSLEKIYGGGHVANCPLTSLTIEYGGWPYESPTGSNAIVAQNNRSLVIGCAATKNLSNLQYIGAEAFWGESQPFSLTLPPGVVRIGKRAFHLAEGLTAINIPINTNSIEEDCFSGTSLTTITLHDGITEIKKQAFMGCQDLKTVYLGRYIKKIEENAFAMCPNVTDVYCSANPDNLQTWDGKGFAETTVFHVTDAAAWQAKFPDATVKFETYAPDEEFVTVGLPSYSSDHPIGATKKYILSQQVYTAEEIGHAAGTITSLGFNTYNGEVSRNYKIYVTKTENTETDSYVPVTDADLVFSGDVYFKAGQWNTIEFDKPIQYDGTSNLMITICDNTGKSGGWGALTNFITSNRKSLEVDSDDQAFDATATNGELGFSHLTYKSQIQLCFEANPKPYNVKVLEVGDVSAQIQCSLREGTKTWNLRYRKAVAEGEQENEWTVANNLTERSKTIEGLTAATKYEAQVQADYGEGVLSVWTSSIPFTTNCCPIEQQAEIRYVLNGSNRVWKNFAVQILDVTEEENPVEVAYLNPPGDNSYEGYLTLCCSHKYKVNWIYDENNPDFNHYYSVALYYEIGDLIYKMATGEAPEEDTELTTFVMDCGDYCAPMPTNLSIDDVFYNNVTISFTSSTEGAKIAYSTEADFNPATATNTQSVAFDADGNSGSSNSYSYKLPGLEPSTDYYVAVQNLCSAQLLDEGGKSRWTKPVKVKTEPEEAPVDNITVVNDGSSKSKVSWTPKGKESKHNIYVRRLTGESKPVSSDQIMMFNLENEKGATFENWGGGTWSSYASSSFDNILKEVSKWFVVTGLQNNEELLVTVDEGDTKTKMNNTDSKTTETYSMGAESLTKGLDAEAMKAEVKSKITNRRSHRNNGKILTKQQWKNKYEEYKEVTADWLSSEDGSEEAKALAKQAKNLKRELGLDKRKVKKATRRSVRAGYKYYKKYAKKKAKTRGTDDEQEEFFAWINHEEGSGYLSISDLKIVSEDDWSEWEVIEGVTGNSYAFDGLTPGTTYEIIIEPVYEDGTTGSEDGVLFTTFGTEADPIEGEFSVSADKKVQFAKGNLQYSMDANWNDHWKLAEHQYDIIGLDNLETQELNEYGNRFTSEDHLDLFCWSTRNSNKGTAHTYPNDSYYKGAFVEWGTLSEFTSVYGEGWQTLSKDEWTYLLSGRENADKLKTLATVNNVKGLILLPDDWTGDAPAATYTAETWATLETAGAVFLPAAGTLTVSSEDSHTIASVNGLDDGIGSYWSSTPSETDINAFATTFNATEVKPAEDIYRRIGSAVRLVKVAEDKLLGDANGDGVVDAADIVEMVNAKDDKASPNFKMKNVDFDGDGKVTDSDIEKVVAIIMGN